MFFSVLRTTSTLSIRSVQRLGSLPTNSFPTLTLTQVQINLTPLAVQSFLSPPKLPQIDQNRDYRFRTSVRRNRDIRPEYFILRDPPLGPHKKLPPFRWHKTRVGRYRRGEWENYKYVPHYPPNNRYTVEKLEMTKLGGRDPVTGRKIIQGIGGGNPRKFRWIDTRRLPKDWDPEGPDYVERVIDLQYDPIRDPVLALTGHGPHVRWQTATANMKVSFINRLDN